MQKKFIIFIIVTLIALFCQAQQYSLEQFITIALQNSYDGQFADTNLKDASGRLRSSYYELLPSASINLYKSSYLDNEPQEWSNSAMITLEKSLYLNDPTFFSIISDNYDRQNAELALDHTVKSIAYTVFDLYLSVLQNQTVLVIQQQNLLLQQKIHQQTNILYENGKKSLLDLRQSEIYLIDYDIAVKDAEIALINSRNSLFNYLNIDDNGSGLAVPEFDTESRPGEFSQNLMIKQKNNSINKTKASLIHQKLSFLPDLSLSYTLYQNNDDGCFTTDDYYRYSNTLSLTASWNIFNLLQKNEAHAITRRSLNLLQLDLDIYRRQLENNLQVLNQELENLESTRNLYQQKLDLAQQNLNMAQQQYQLGTIDLIGLDRNRLDLQNAQLSYNTRYYNLIRKQQEINLLLSHQILGKW
ncbi:MAG: TolC family protein [Candidatus Stygibacter australis]|nr:TolC family protein [Candidatus Stygibacter australis]MDP8322753.1 TolC family protein [Candidatus Stygibacter australis]